MRNYYFSSFTIIIFDLWCIIAPWLLLRWRWGYQRKGCLSSIDGSSRIRGCLFFSLLCNIPIWVNITTLTTASLLILTFRRTSPCISWKLWWKWHHLIQVLTIIFLQLEAIGCLRKMHSNAGLPSLRRDEIFYTSLRNSFFDSLFAWADVFVVFVWNSKCTRASIFSDHCSLIYWTKWLLLIIIYFMRL